MSLITYHKRQYKKGQSRNIFLPPHSQKFGTLCRFALIDNTTIRRQILWLCENLEEVWYETSWNFEPEIGLRLRLCIFLSETRQRPRLHNSVSNTRDWEKLLLVYFCFISITQPDQVWPCWAVLHTTLDKEQKSQFLTFKSC